MYRVLIIFIFGCGLSACSTTPGVSSEALPFAIEKNGFRIVRLEDDPETVKLQEAVKRVIANRDLTRFLFRRNLLLLGRGRPFSPANEPSIYLSAKSRSTDYAGDENRLLSTILHEELHAYLAQFPEAVVKAKIDLKRLFPPETLPKDPNMRADDIESDYLHLIVCWFEYDSLKRFIGPQGAHELIAEGKVYRWIYDQVLTSNEKIAGVLRTSNLINPMDTKPRTSQP